MSEKHATTRKPRRTVSVDDRFGRWTVIGVPFHNSAHQLQAVCQCDCGSVSVIRCDHLKSGLTNSCGCLQRQIARSSSTTHGMTGTPLHAIWVSMLQRCRDKNAENYERYGGRGILVCEEWQELKPFADWAMANGYQEGLSIERLDANGNYEPGNCKWIPLILQSRNTRRSRYLTAFGETKVVAAWLEDSRCVVSRACLRTRIDLGWEAERAITLPAHG